MRNASRSAVTQGSRTHHLPDTERDHQNPDALSRRHTAPRPLDRPGRFRALLGLVEPRARIARVGRLPRGSTHPGRSPSPDRPRRDLRLLRHRCRAHREPEPQVIAKSPRESCGPPRSLAADSKHEKHNGVDWSSRPSLHALAISIPIRSSWHNTSSSTRTRRSGPSAKLCSIPDGHGATRGMGR